MFGRFLNTLNHAMFRRVEFSCRNFLMQIIFCFLTVFAVAESLRGIVRGFTILVQARSPVQLSPDDFQKRISVRASLSRVFL